MRKDALVELEERYVRAAIAGRAEVPDSTLDPLRVGEIYQGALAAEDRRTKGAFYTPPALVNHLLDESLEPLLAAAQTPADVLALRVVDPSCGVGYFLIEARRRLSRRLMELGSAEDPSCCLFGVDLDPVAVALATGLLPGATFFCEDALLGAWLEPGGYDVVIGNPPFLNRLESATAPDAESARSYRADGGAYTDLSAIFLSRALHWVRPVGRVAMVQPVSLLATRDAGPVRSACQDAGALVSLWASADRMFEAGVRTCAVVIERGAQQGPVTLLSGSPVEEVGSWADELPPSWGPLLARIQGIPEVRLEPTRLLGELADCSADFRDEYYGLIPFVYDDLAGTNPPLITTGLIDPAQCLWGQRTIRFAKSSYSAPRIDVESLPAKLKSWARRRLVPKVLVGTQGKVIEAVADEQGGWLPSVPVISVVPHSEADLWLLAAVLMSPPIAAYCAASYAGTALHLDAIKVSAKQVAGLPVPMDEGLWSRAGELVRTAQQRGSRDDLVEAGRLMTRAYESDDEVFQWWLARLGKAKPPPAR